MVLRKNTVSLIDDYLTNNGRFSDSHEFSKKVYVLNVILLVMLITCIFYVVADILIEMYVAAAVNLLAVVLVLFIMVYFKRTDNYKLSSYLSVAVLLLILTVFFKITGNQNYAFYWLAIMPSISYCLLGGKKAGIVVTLYGCFFLLFIFFNYKSWVPSQFNLESVLNIAGATISLALMIAHSEKARNITWTALNKTNEVLESSQNELKTILDTAAEGIFGIDSEGRFTFCNRRCLELLDYKDACDLIGKSIFGLVYGKKEDGSVSDRNDYEIYKTLISGEKISSDDEVFWRSDNSYFEVEFHSLPMYKDNQIIGAVVTFMDITNRKRAHAKLQYMNNHDSLTGLINRKSLLTEMSRLNKEEYLPLSIIFVDLNGLKLINDIFGHEAGDNLILTAAGILHSVSEKKDIVARIGGDEFVWLLPNTDSVSASAAIEKVRAQANQYSTATVKCSMALGSHTRTGLDECLTQTMKYAEDEMYREKSSQRKSFEESTLQDLVNNLHEMSPYNKSHSENVSKICETMGIALNWSKHRIRILKDAGYYHDIGKTVLSRALVVKTSPLTPREKTELAQHPVVGFRLMNLFSDKLDLADSIYYHHEYWNGSGYPKGLKGEEIPENSRVIALAEQYDHLRNCQKGNPMSREDALRQIQLQAGIKYDPKLAELFVSLQKNYD